MSELGRTKSIKHEIGKQNEVADAISRSTKLPKVCTTGCKAENTEFAPLIDKYVRQQTQMKAKDEHKERANATTSIIPKRMIRKPYGKWNLTVLMTLMAILHGGTYIRIIEAKDQWCATPSSSHTV